MAYSFDLEVHLLLASWARWVRADSTGLGYKSPMALLMRGQEVERKKPMRAAFIDDDNALKIERLVTRLCEHRPLTGKILILRYVENMSAGAISKYFQTRLEQGKDNGQKISRNEALNHIAFAEGFMTSLFERTGLIPPLD